MQKILALALVLFAVTARATVPVSTSELTYPCDGLSTGPFPVTFRFLEASHLVVTVEAVGVATATLAITTDYTVANTGTVAGGAVTLVAGDRCPNASTLRIARTVPLTQPTSLRSQGGYSPGTHENAFDRLTMAAQQLARLDADLAATHAADVATQDTRDNGQDSLIVMKRNTSDQATKDAAQDAEIASRLGYRWLGAWNAATTYAKQDAVSYNGTSYLALGVSTNAQPDVSPASWVVVAAQGGVGPTGPSGVGPFFGNPGATFYVKSDTGNDVNDCLTWTSACKTILGAYDKVTSQGTIYFADQSWVGGEVANQGLWFIGTNDPGWPAIPAGFRAQKNVRFVGAGSYFIQFGRPTGARIVGGQGIGWAADRNKPALHLAGTFAPMTFQNMIISGATRAAVIGHKADLSTYALAMVASKWFVNCQFSARTGHATDSGIDGPTVDIGYAFWAYFEDSVIHAYTTADVSLAVGDDRHAAVLIRDSGLQYFTGGRWAQGGVKSYTPGVFMDGIMVESDGVQELPPVFWAKNTANAGGEAYAHIKDVARADNPGGAYPEVQIEAGTTGANAYAALEKPEVGKAVIVNCGYPCSVKGPATLMGGARVFGTKGYAGGVLTPAPRAPAQRQAGIILGRVYGQYDGVRRQFGPTPVRFTNLASNTYATDGNRQIAAVDAPDGRTGKAWRVTPLVASGEVLVVPHTARTWAVGDKFAIGLWVRFPSGNRAAGAGDPNGKLSFASANVANILNGSAAYIAASAITTGPGDGDWKWLSAAGIVTTAGAPAADLVGKLQFYDAAYPFEFYGPVAYHIPAASMTDNEFGEFIDAMSSHAKVAPVGSKAVSGDLAIYDGRLGLHDGTAWTYVGTGTAAPVAGTCLKGDVVINSSPDATEVFGWRCTVAGSPGTWQAIPGQAAAQANSVAGDVATLVSDFNALLGKLRTSGVLAP